MPLDDAVAPPVDSGHGDDPVFEEAVAALGASRSGARLLRAVALVAIGLWVVGTFSMAWELWDSFPPGERWSSPGGNRLTLVATQVGSSTWGYLFVAVVSYAASLVVDMTRTKEALEISDHLG